MTTSASYQPAEANSSEYSAQTAERSVLALDTLASLARQFAGEPDLDQLVKAIVLSMSGQFAVSSVFALIRTPRTELNRTSYLGQGAFSDAERLPRLTLTPDFCTYFVANPTPQLIGDLDLPESCSDHRSALVDANVVLLCPFVHANRLLGLVGLGSKITGKDYDAGDLKLIESLVNILVPLMSWGYRFWETVQIRNWYHDILNSVKQGVFVFSNKYHLKKINQAGLTMLSNLSGLTDDLANLSGNSFDDVFPERLFPGWTARIAEARKSGFNCVLEQLKAQGDEEEYAFDVFLNRIATQEDQPADFIVTLDDVTERVQIAHALKLTQFAVDNQADAAYWMGPDGRFVYVNEAACRSLGYSQHELLEMQVHDIDPNFSPETWPEQWDQLKEKGSLLIESVHRRKGGTEFPVGISANFVTFGGREYNCALARDLTDRNRAAELERSLLKKLEHAQRMEAIGTLAGGVAHDLNNMLGPLVGYPELMLMKLPDDSPLRKMVTTIASSAKQAADVVQDLLTLGRRGRYDMLPMNVNDTVRSYLESPNFQSLVQSRPDVRTRTHLQENLTEVSGSDSHLTKVIMNLVVNAFDAMPDEGELTIKTSQQYLTSLRSGFDKITHGDYVIISVCDTGMGIDESEVHRLFEPYYSTKTMGTSGTGLGLAVVYGVIKDHHGYYDVLSEVGRGTEFVLYLPACEVAVAPSPKKDTDYNGHEKVLVVDDLETQRDMVVELLSASGYSVKSVATGREAVQYLRNHTVDIVVLDMIIENDFDGLDTYREMLRICPDQKAIIFSGFSVTDRVREAQRLGVGAYLKKPCTRKEICKTIREELDCETGISRTE